MIVLCLMLRLMHIIYPPITMLFEKNNNLFLMSCSYNRINDKFEYVINVLCSCLYGILLLLIVINYVIRLFFNGIYSL